jgi:hypothetical protein
MRRTWPALGLFLLAPLVAEFLLGDVPINMPETLLILAPMYGGGALLIREIVRRTGRGWVSIAVLALAYGIVEEAFMTESLFNPNYLGLNLRLLEPAYVPALGIGLWWTVLVLTMHTVWSISVSIALAEALTPRRATEPWLGNVGLVSTALLFALIAVLASLDAVRSDKGHFVASAGQFTWSAVLAVVVIVIAFLVPRPSPRARPGWVPSPGLVGLGTLATGSFVLLVPGAWGRRAVAVYLVLDLLVVACLGLWSRRAAWHARHRLALAGGAALAYAWYAFTQHPVVGQTSMTIVRLGNGVFAAGLIVLLAVAARRQGDV